MPGWPAPSWPPARLLRPSASLVRSTIRPLGLGGNNTSNAIGCLINSLASRTGPAAISLFPVEFFSRCPRPSAFDPLRFFLGSLQASPSSKGSSIGNPALEAEEIRIEFVRWLTAGLAS